METGFERQNAGRAPGARRAAGLLSIVLAAAAMVFPVAPEAQYFGRNKVLWERFDFEILETEHFRIHYYPPQADHAEYVADIAERWYTRLSGFFDHEFEERKPIIIYQDHADFQQTVIAPGVIGEGTGGFTESQLDRIVLPLTGVNADNDHVIGHELVHAFQFDIARSLQDAQQRVRMQQLPLWVMEGLAEYLSQGRVDPTTAMWMRDAVVHESLPEPGRLIQRRPSPYQYGQAVWAYVGGRWDDDAVRRLFVGALTSGVDGALEDMLGIERDAFFREFHETLRSSYADVIEGREGGDASAVRLLDLERTGGAVNLAPSLSPDGRSVAFLSTRELELELYLADTATGEVQRRLIRSEADPHFQNLSFMDSSVAWSPDGSRFAFGVFAQGERRLAIYDVERGRVERRLDLPGIKGMRHAAWTPDGEAIVFSAAAGSASDLYRVELDSNELTRLTDDPYTAIQPSVSPDGSEIVFVTDRGGRTDISRLHFGEFRLAMLDVDSGDIEVLPLFERGKHIDPEFSADGESIYFIGEPDGVADVFRYDLADGGLTRLTSLRTGVSGITALSPALSVAADGTLAYSVLEDSRYTVYRQRGAEGAPVTRSHDFSAAVLPPGDGLESSLVESYLADPDRGLPGPARSYPTQDYAPRVGLTNLGPASVGVSSSDFGSGAGGAFSAYFSDPLNRHQLVTTFRGGSSQGALDFEDTIGADATYLNQTRRFQWGARLARIPYLSGSTFLRRDIVEVDGTPMPADIRERVIFGEQVNELSMIGQYPFSLNSRLEAAAGISQIDFERQVERLVFPAAAAPFRETQSLPSPQGLDLQQGSLAFVRDTATFGFGAPVRGTRLRLENQWTTGDLSFRTTRVDYRRYLFRRPLTFAFRLLHLGRHGSDADDPRLPLLDIGSNTLVRGYDLDSFDLSECTATGTMTSCPEFDRLIGSRIAVMNFELRVPLLGTEEFGLFNVPVAPTEAVFFVDAGAAWSSGQSVELSFDRNTAERVPVVSAGVAARTILFGALPLEFFYAHPFQRPQEDSVFGVRFGVGW